MRGQIKKEWMQQKLHNKLRMMLKTKEDELKKERDRHKELQLYRTQSTAGRLLRNGQTEQKTMTPTGKVRITGGKESTKERKRQQKAKPEEEEERDKTQRELEFAQPM